MIRDTLQGLITEYSKTISVRNAKTILGEAISNATTRSISAIVLPASASKLLFKSKQMTAKTDISEIKCIIYAFSADDFKYADINSKEHVVVEKITLDDLSMFLLKEVI